MSKKVHPAPNTILGEVHWYADMHFGTLLWVCQMMLGYGDPKHKCKIFLNTEKYDVRDFFGEFELSDGMLGLELFADPDWHTIVLCEIETKIPYADAEMLNDEKLLSLVADFKEYVRSLPFAKAGEGALITDPADPRYREASNQAWLHHVIEVNQALGATFEAAKEQLRSEGIEIIDATTETDDEIPF